MKIETLFPNFINVSAENFTKIKNYINSLNSDNDEDYSVTSKPLKDFTEVVKTSNTTYRTKDLENVGGWPFNDPSKEVEQEFSEFFEERIEKQIYNTIKPYNDVEFAFRVYDNEQELEEHNKEMAFFLKTVESINTDFSKFVGDSETYIEKDGEIKNLKNVNDILKKLRAYKLILRSANVHQDAAPQNNATPAPQTANRDGALNYAKWLLKENINYTGRYMINRYGFNLVSEGTKVTEEDFNLFKKPEVITFLLDNLEPGEVKYLLNQFIKDNPANLESLMFSAMISTASTVGEDGVITMLKTKLPGLSEDSYKKLYKAIVAPEIVIQVDDTQKEAEPPQIPDQNITPAPPPVPSGGGNSSGSGGGTPPPAPGAGPGAVTNGQSSLGQEMDARGAQISQGSNYRQGSRTSGQAMRPISSAGGPEYYIRISPGRFRPAVQADMDAGLDLFMKNPNPIYAGFNPYVKVDKMAMKARRAGPVDQDAVNREMSAQGIRRASAATPRDFDREMKAQGYQKLGPGGKRVEADGSVRRKSQFGGVAGSLSNFFGDVGNTLKKKRP